MDRNVLIITGMHRSGTSLMTNLIQSGGLHIGDNLLKPNRTNRHGFFEDVDFWSFQDQILKKRGFNDLSIPEETIHWTDEEINKAKDIINSKSAVAFWGWKDPRTCLFLNQWFSLLPEAKFVFVFRHPLYVLLSLIYAVPVSRDPMLVIHGWYVYNKHILDFYKANRQRSILCHISGVIRDIEKFREIVKTKFGFDMQLNLEQIYHPIELKDMPINSFITQYMMSEYKPVYDLYQQLQGEADLSFYETGKTNIKDDIKLLNYAIEASLFLYNATLEKYEHLRRSRVLAMVDAIYKYPIVGRLLTSIFNTLSKVWYGK